MPLTRLRNAFIALIVTSVLTYVWWPTVVDLSARQRAYDAIQPGMTLGEVERLMRGSGELQFNKITGDLDYHAAQWKKYGHPHLYTWEDAYSTVFVTFRAPEPNPPVVVSVSQTLKKSPELNSLLFWRIILAAFWLFSLDMLVRAALTRKPVDPVAEPTDALNSHPASDTTNGADSPV